MVRLFGLRSSRGSRRRGLRRSPHRGQARVGDRCRRQALEAVGVVGRAAAQVRRVSGASPACRARSGATRRSRAACRCRAGWDHGCDERPLGGAPASRSTSEAIVRTSYGVRFRALAARRSTVLPPLLERLASDGRRGSRRSTTARRSTSTGRGSLRRSGASGTAGTPRSLGARGRRRVGVPVRRGVTLSLAIAIRRTWAAWSAICRPSTPPGRRSSAPARGADAAAVARRRAAASRARAAHTS